MIPSRFKLSYPLLTSQRAPWFLIHKSHFTRCLPRDQVPWNALRAWGHSQSCFLQLSLRLPAVPPVSPLPTPHRSGRCMAAPSSSLVAECQVVRKPSRSPLFFCCCLSLVISSAITCGLFFGSFCMLKHTAKHICILFKMSPIVLKTAVK